MGSTWWAGMLSWPHLIARLTVSDVLRMRWGGAEEPVVRLSSIDPKKFSWMVPQFGESPKGSRVSGSPRGLFRSPFGPCWDLAARSNEPNARHNSSARHPKLPGQPGDQYPGVPNECLLCLTRVRRPWLPAETGQTRGSCHARYQQCFGVGFVCRLDGAPNLSRGASRGASWGCGYGAGPNFSDGFRRARGQGQSADGSWRTGSHPVRGWARGGSASR